MPTLDLKDPNTVAALINYFLQTGDMLAFEQLLGEELIFKYWWMLDNEARPVECETQLGKWCAISKDDFG